MDAPGDALSDSEREYLAETCQVICKHYGERFKLCALTPPERVFWLVYLSKGVIDNGGFRYLFEADVEGDPDYSLTQAAYDSIGARHAANAISETLGLFPKGRPFTDRNHRLRYYLSRIRSWPTPQDSQFFRAGDETERCLYEYARRTVRLMPHLNGSPGMSGPQARYSEPPPRSPELPASEDFVRFSRLPRWARASLLARCGRAVLPLYRHFWPGSDRAYTDALLTAIQALETSAEAGRLDPRLAGAHTAAVRATGAALAAGSEVLSNSPPAANALAASRAAGVARLVADSIEATQQDGEGAIRSAYAIVESAIELVLDLKQRTLGIGMMKEVRRLIRAAKRGNWTDDTPIPAQIFSMLDDDSE